MTPASESSALAAIETICWASTSSALRGHDGRLDLAGAHELADDRALEQVGAELREDPALADVADVVAGAADALQAAGDGLRRLDLQDEVDGAHVDAELQRRGRHEAGQLAGLQQLLDDGALLARERAVVGARDVDAWCVVRQLGVGELVEPQCEPFRAAARVDEDDRRAVCLDEPQDLGVDRRPDRAARRLAAGDVLHADRAGRLRRRLLGLDHRLDRHVDLQVQRLAHAGVDDRARPRRGPTMKRPTSSSGFCVADRPIRCGSRPSACSAARRSSVSARCEPRFVAATAWISSRMIASTPVRISRAPLDEHQVERLGRRDEDVRRVAAHRRAIPLRRVAGPHADAEVGADPAQRRAQVAVDVVGERLQRRDVDEAGARARSRPRGAAQAVQSPEERRQRLARPGRRRDEHVLAGRDRRPGLRLDLGRSPRTPT